MRHTLGVRDTDCNASAPHCSGNSHEWPQGPWAVLPRKPDGWLVDVRCLMIQLRRLKSMKYVHVHGLEDQGGCAAPPPPLPPPRSTASLALSVSTKISGGSENILADHDMLHDGSMARGEIEAVAQPNKMLYCPLKESRAFQADGV